jgi:hypothetical protein
MRATATVCVTRALVCLCRPRATHVMIGTSDDDGAFGDAGYIFDANVVVYVVVVYVVVVVVVVVVKW